MLTRSIRTPFFEEETVNADQVIARLLCGEISPAELAVVPAVVKSEALKRLRRLASGSAEAAGVVPRCITQTLELLAQRLSS